MSFFAGLIVGLYAGAVFREEYHFPTTEKVASAVNVFRKNEETIKKAQESQNKLALPEINKNEEKKD